MLEKKRKLFAISPIFNFSWARHNNYLNLWNEGVYEKGFFDSVKSNYKSEWENKRNTLSMYLQICYGDANTPEYRKYRFEWKPAPAEAHYVPPSEETRDKSVPGAVCVNAKSYVDFYMWHLDRNVRLLSENGKIPVHAYLDYSADFPWCQNHYHGCPKEGRRNIRAHRQYMKRMYTIYKSQSPANQILSHCSGWLTMASWGFADVMIEGEEMTAYYNFKLANDEKLEKNYLALLPLERIQSHYQPYAFGTEKYFLYQFWGWNSEEPDKAEPARAHLWGLMLSHDVGIWAAGNPPNIVRALEELPWDDKVEFVPYWRKDSGINVSASIEPVLASGWRRGNGNLMVMVLNDSDEEARCRLSLDFAKYGFTADTIECLDYGTGGLAYPESFKEQEVKKIKLADGETLSFEVGRHSYKLMRFSQ